MTLFLETYELICQVEATCNRNHHVLRAGEGLCVELSNWFLTLNLSLSSEAYTGETEEGREIA